MASNRLIYLPLGGAGEIGMNCYVYGYGPAGAERYILVDTGVTFPNMDSTPGVNLIFADISWLVERLDRIEAIFITHAHEDHVGAIGLLYKQLPLPIYARKFTAAIARLKLEEHGHALDNVIEIGPYPEQVSVGPFKVGFVPTAHSIPESSALVIDTPKGRLVHTGDFKTDEAPLVGEPFAPDVWREIAKPGIRALICDSTNVFSPEPGRSESTLIKPISDLIRTAQGLVVATTFASNVARLKTLAQAGVDAGRSVAVMGRAMKRMISVAQSTGVLTDFPPIVDRDQARDIPRAALMILVTGSQGERRAGSAQLSNGKYNGVTLRQGDMFLFSSKTIPGNELSVGQIVNRFSEMGVQVVDETDGFYHVSGHANRPDLQKMHRLLEPQILIPMHGEHRHLRSHSALAQAGGIASIIAPNGSMVDLSRNKAEIVEHIDTGRSYLDGSLIIGAMDGVVRDRIRMALNGQVVVTLIIDEDDEPLGGVRVETLGLPQPAAPQQPLARALEEGIEYQLASAGNKIMLSDDALSDLIRRAVRKISQEIIGKRPECQIIIDRLVAA